MLTIYYRVCRHWADVARIRCLASPATVTIDTLNRSRAYILRHFLKQSPVFSEKLRLCFEVLKKEVYDDHHLRAQKRYVTPKGR